MSGKMASRRGEDIAAEVVMMRQIMIGPFLVVEGPSDERFLAPRITKSCYVAIGSGRTTVERAVCLLESGPRTIKNVLGIVDEDYDWLIGYQVGSTNIVKTDPRDVEGLLLKFNDLSCVLAEYADRVACTRFENSERCSVLDGVLSRAEPFGRIRMVNALGPKVDLGKFTPVRFFKQDWTYDITEAKRVAVGLGVSPSVSDLESAMTALNLPDIWHCVRGHDLVEILVGGLKTTLGGKSVDKIGVERLLRQSLSRAQFSASQLHARIQSWSAGNLTVLL